MPAREHLIVVLPGIGGSVLAPPGNPDSPVWSAGLREVGDILRRPERLALGTWPRLEPVGLIRSRKAFGVWTAVRGYDRLLRMLGALPDAVVDDGSPAGRNLDATVVAVPYDFRLGIADAAQRLDDQVSQRLRHLWPADPPDTPRVVIVAHSMGGLVARWWLTDPSRWGVTRALVTLGTPHRGAPKALDVLANGVNAKVCRITRPVGVLREWPSVQQLLPRYPAVLDTRTPPVAAGPRLMRPHELPFAWLGESARAAWHTHEQIEQAWRRMPRDGGPELVARIGYGHGTLRSCEWDGTHLRVSKSAPTGLDMGRWADDEGDGTVPAYSGLPLEMDRHAPRDLRVRQRHGAIATTEEIVELVETYEGRPPLLPVRGQERPANLGLDIDEVHAAGEPVDITVRVRGVDGPVGDASCFALVSAHDGTADELEVPLDLDSATGSFHGRLPGLACGLYRVRVLAEEVAGAGDLHAGELIEVIDGDDAG